MKTKYKEIGKIGLAVTLAACSLNLVIAQTKTVVINKATKHQKMDGFGAYGLNKTAWDNPPYHDANFVKTVVEDLGLTISRAEMYDNETENDNNNPMVADASKFKLNAFNTEYCKFAKEAQALAYSKGDTIKFFYSYWTPPAWMKYVNSLTGTDHTWNRLIAKDFTPPEWNTFVLANKPAANPDDYKDELVENAIMHTKMFKENTGFDLYGLSLQNELTFAQPYQSCVYSPEQFRELLKVAGPRFRKEFPNLKFIMHEDIGDLGRFSQYMNSVTRDAEAKKYQDIGACHAYNTSATLAGSTSAATWDGMYRVTNRNKPTPFWMTETSGYGGGWEGGISLAKAMYVALKFGKISAWVWWQLGENTSNGAESNYSLFSNSNKSKRYFTTKHFARYVRPNAVSVGATCAEDADILPLAFQHDVKKTLTVILINQATTDKKVKLSFADASITPANYKMYLSNASNDCADKGSVVAGADISIPANSLITLMGEGSMPIITSNDDAENVDVSFLLYPNPASTLATVEYKNNLNTVIEITDAYSRVVKSIPAVFTLGSYTTEINLEDLTNGVYFVKIGNKAKKLVINR